ncbi:MAG: hypothetical protein IH596_13940 [Bacteroidales bacterium]|nr:hypothetical protein [Bacteroidales bacterium]
MKKRITPFFAILALMAFGLSGCTDDDPTPAPADPRQIFLGIWSVTETETRLTYEVNIEIDTKSQNGGVYIYNFANSGTSSNPAYAFVSGNTISLDINQVIGDNWIVNGSGSLSGTKINWPYTLNDGATLHYISAVYTKL